MEGLIADDQRSLFNARVDPRTRRGVGARSGSPSTRSSSTSSTPTRARPSRSRARRAPAPDLAVLYALRVATLELTAAELRLLRSALNAFLDDFGHEEADVVAEIQSLIAKLPPDEAPKPSS